MKDPDSTASDPETGAHPLIEALSLLEESAPPDVIDDAALEAYRHGELEGAELEDVERRLARSPSSRHRLIELGGGKLPSPSPFLRARVLRAFGSRRRRGVGTALGIAAVVLVGVIGLLLPGAGGELPPDLTYAVDARGLAEVRSDEAAGGAVIEAYAETPVELEVAPENVADADVEFSIYRLDGTTWVRVAGGGDATVSRGAAVFRLPASRLVGAVPGR
ncbi:MAG: hypothetical protein AAFY88_27410, partial [Acidobacteriota bacterium]